MAGQVATVLKSMSDSAFGGGLAPATPNNPGIVGPTAPDKDDPPRAQTFPEKPIAPDKVKPLPRPTPDLTPAPAPAPAPAPTNYTIPPANENDSVESRVTGLISKDSDLMKLAAHQGALAANRRGLRNSSIAIGASQAEVLKQAVPIAAADASAALQKNLQREGQGASLNQLQLQLASSDRQQDKQLAAQMAQLQKQIESAEGQQKLDLEAQMARLQQQGQQQMALQTVGDAAAMSRLQTQLASSDNQQARDIAAQMERLNAQLQNATAQQRADIEAQMARLVTSGQQALTLQGAGDTAAMQRLAAQLASSDQQQQRDIGAQMERLLTSGNAEMQRLQAQLTNANAQQRLDIESQMQRLQESQRGELERLTAAAGFDMARLQEQGRIDFARDAGQARNAQDLARVQGELQSRLQAQGNTEQMQRMTLDLANQLQVQDRQLAGDLSKIAAQGNEEIRRLVEAANQERVTLQQSIAAQDRQAMAQAMVNVFQVEAQMRSALLGNTTIPASERAAYERTITALGDPIRTYVNTLFGTAGAPIPAPTGTSTDTPTDPGNGLGGLGEFPTTPTLPSPTGTGTGTGGGLGDVLPEPPASSTTGPLPPELVDQPGLVGSTAGLLSPGELDRVLGGGSLNERRV